MREKYYVMYQENENLINTLKNKKSLILMLQCLIIFLYVTNYLGLSYLCTIYGPAKYIFWEANIVFGITELITVIFLYKLFRKKLTPLVASIYMVVSIGGGVNLFKSASVGIAISNGGAKIWLLYALSIFIALFWIIMVVRVRRRYEDGGYKKEPEKTFMNHLRIKLIVWGVLSLPLIPFTFYYFRTRGINEVSGRIQAYLMVYGAVWMFTIIIFTYLARNVVFIILETRTRLRLGNNEKTI